MSITKKLNPEGDRIPVKYPGGCAAAFLTAVILAFVGPGMLKLFWNSISYETQKIIVISIIALIAASFVAFGIWLTKQINS